MRNLYGPACPTIHNFRVIVFLYFPTGLLIILVSITQQTILQFCLISKCAAHKIFPTCDSYLLYHGLDLFGICFWLQNWWHFSIPTCFPRYWQLRVPIFLSLFSIIILGISFEFSLVSSFVFSFEFVFGVSVEFSFDFSLEFSFDFSFECCVDYFLESFF